MKFEGWTRKLVKELKACGFKMEPANSTSHHKFNYHGNEMIFPEFINVPIKVKNSSRLKTVDSIKKQFKKFNAPEKYMKRINKISMGLITAEAGDGIEELEDKLMTALRASNAIASAEFAAAIQTLAHAEGLHPYTIKSIGHFKNEQAKKIAKVNTILQINTLLERLFKAAVARYIDQHGSIHLSTENAFIDTNHLDLSTKNLAGFGFSITSIYCFGREQPFEIGGALTGGLAQVFEDYQKDTTFQIELDNDHHEDEPSYYTNTEFCRFNVRLKNTEQVALENLLESLRLQETFQSLQGYGA